MSKKKRRKSKKYPKKPLTPFFLYSQEMRELVARRVKKKFGKNDIAEVGRELGRMWNKLEKYKKEKYVKQFEKEKKEYERVVKKFRELNPNFNFYEGDDDETNYVLDDEEYEPPNKKRKINHQNYSIEKKKNDNIDLNVIILKKQWTAFGLYTEAYRRELIKSLKGKNENVDTVLKNRWDKLNDFEKKDYFDDALILKNDYEKTISNIKTKTQ